MLVSTTGTTPTRAVVSHSLSLHLYTKIQKRAPPNTLPTDSQPVEIQVHILVVTAIDVWETPDMEPINR